MQEYGVEMTPSKPLSDLTVQREKSDHLSPCYSASPNRLETLPNVRFRLDMDSSQTTTRQISLSDHDHSMSQHTGICLQPKEVHTTLHVYAAVIAAVPDYHM